MDTILTIVIVGVIALACGIVISYLIMKNMSNSLLKKAEKELAALEKQLNRLKKQGAAADPFDEIFYPDEQQK